MSRPLNTRHESEKLERAVESFARLLEMSRDIERNQEDAAFRRAGGEIIHVFDENTFEIFCDPARRNFGAASFYAQDLSKATDKGLQRRFQAQSVLLASEFVIAGALPGRSTGHRLYMTPWHRQELLTRVGEIADDIGGAHPPGEDRLFDLFTLKSGELALDRALANGEKSIAAALRLATSDARDMDPAERERFVATRVACDLLAGDRADVRLSQLRRLLRPPILDRFRSLHTDFELSPADYQVIAAEAKDWFNRMAARRKQSPTPNARVNASLWFDAQSLAMVRLLANRVRRQGNRKLVFVTGDSLMFEAYRQWFVDASPDQESFYESFLLRRIGQFSPIFNLQDGQTDLGRTLASEDAAQLFAKVRQSVEVALIPFNLSILTQRKEPTELSPRLNRGREYLAHLGPRNLAASFASMQGLFLRNQAEEWAAAQTEADAKVVKAWRRLERLAIGLSSSAVLRRYQSVSAVVSGGPSDRGAGASDRVRESFERAAEGARHDSYRLWLPFARDAIEVMRRGSVTVPARIPATIWYTTKAGNRVRDLIGAPSEEGGGKIDISPDMEIEDMFAVVAAVCVRYGNWEEAERFADLGFQSFDHRTSIESADLSARHELDFMCSIVKRFRAGQLRGHLQATSGNVATDSLVTLDRKMTLCLNILDRCQRFCLEHPAETRYELGLLRISSEKAAVHMFRAASGLSVGIEGLVQRLEPRIANDLEDAELHLCECKSLYDAYRGGVHWGKYARESVEDLSMLHRQFVSNSAANSVLAWTLLQTLRETLAQEFTPKASAQSIADDIRELGNAQQHLPEIVRYELRVFDCLLNGAARPPPPEGLISDPSSLPIDVALAHRIDAALRRRDGEGARRR